MPSIDDWKRTLLTLEDEPFFELIKNHLGKVQTPYHKPSIIDRIEKFLLSPETRRRILALLSKEETAVTGFILRSGGSDFAHLYRYFQDTYTELRFQTLLENLQERLIIYREESGSYYVTPVLEDDLDTLTVEKPVPVKNLTENQEESWFSEEMMISFTAFLQDNPVPFKQSGEMKKNVAIGFRDMFSRDLGEENFKLCLETMVCLGILQDTGDRFSVNPDQLEAFISLPEQERFIVLASGIAAGAWQESPPLRAFAAGRTIISTLRENTSGALGYQRDSLIKFLSAEFSRENQRFTPKRISRSFDRLIEAGYMDENDGFVKLRMIRFPGSGGQLSPMILQPSFEVLLPPGASGAARLFASLYCRLTRYDRVSHFEIEQERFTEALRNIGDNADIPGLLEKACEGAVPQNVLMTLQGWMERIQQIEIATGTVIQVVPELIPVIQQEFGPMILKTLAPGVYFVKPERLSPFITKWKALGYSDPGEVRNLLSTANHDGSFDYSVHLYGTPSIPTKSPEKNHPGEPEGKENYECRHITEELMAQLNSLKLSPEHRRELKAKVSKKLLIFPRQLSTEVCRIGRIEARGIDFHAKIRIIEDVLENREDLLEIESPELSDGSALVYPLSLTKDPGDPSLTALLLPEEIEQTFKIRRASRIRKRKRSVFY